MDSDRHRHREEISGQNGQVMICVNLHVSAVNFFLTLCAMRHALCCSLVCVCLRLNSLNALRSAPCALLCPGRRKSAVKLLEIDSSAL